MTGAIHVVGAGLAGLSAAVRAAAAGRRVVLYEASRQAGGRCRSFHDRILDRVIDNGAHLVLSGNAEAMAYLELIGARDRMIGPRAASFEFFDCADGRRWTLRPGDGAIPLWLLQAARRAPGTRAVDYLVALRLLAAPADAAVADVIPPSHPLYRPFWEPLTVAALNAAPERAAASLLRAVMLRTFLRGGSACRPLSPRESLADAFVDPALAFLARNGAEIRWGAAARALRRERGRVVGLEFGEGVASLGDGDQAILAAPPRNAARLLPELDAPEEGAVILNAHFAADAVADEPRFVGVLGGTAQWAFARPGLVSVTVSDAGGLLGRDDDALTAALWADAAAALSLPPEPLPPGRLIVEKRATMAQTPENLRKRPGCRTATANLWLAGDWTDTGLPATIEGAILSGRRAAEQALRAGANGRL